VALIAELGLADCRWCDSPLPTAGTKSGRSPLTAHEGACEANPRRWRRTDPLGPAPAGTAETPAPGSATPPPHPSPRDGAELLLRDQRAWSRARRAFLSAVPPTADGWAPFVASPTRTHCSVPPGLLRAWRLLRADALSWVRREPQPPLSWLWLLLLPSVILHHPALGRAAASPPLTQAQRATTLLTGDFAAAVADRDAGVWRSPPRAARPRQGSPSGGGPTAAQRRALRLVRAGRLGAAASALTAAPVAPRAPAIWATARALFPPARPGLATAATLEVDFPDALAAAAEIGRAAGDPAALPRGAVDAVIRRAPRGSAPGPS